MNRDQVLYDLMTIECEECPFNKMCDAYMYNSDICFCTVLTNEIEELEWWEEEEEEKKPITLRDLGFGDDDTPAKYVEIGDKRGYLGAMFGVEGDWKIVIANKYGRETKYLTVRVKDLSEIKGIDDNE